MLRFQLYTLHGYWYWQIVRHLNVGVAELVADSMETFDTEEEARAAVAEVTGQAATAPIIVTKDPIVL